MIVAVTESWPEAAIAIAGIAFVTIVLAVTIWQVFATGRTGLSLRRENAYRKLAEEATEAQRRTAEGLQKAVAEIVELRNQTKELDRLLRQVD